MLLTSYFEKGVQSTVFFLLQANYLIKLFLNFDCQEQFILCSPNKQFANLYYSYRLFNEYMCMHIN